MNGYVGRVISCGLTHEGEPIAIYALTARSAVSKARVLISKSDGLWVEPTSDLQGGDPSLLYYRASFRQNHKLFIANGMHSERFVDSTSIESALQDEIYEPDEPIFTPRIAAVFDLEALSYSFASLTRSPDGSCKRSFTHFNDLKAGVAHRIQTYEGDVQNPRAFVDPPIAYTLPSTNIGQTIFDQLDPTLRIALAVIRSDGYELINTQGA